MSRLFDPVSSQYLQTDSAPVTVAPFTMACWVYVDDLAPTEIPVMMFVGDLSTAVNFWTLRVNTSDANEFVQFVSRGTTARAATTTTGVSLNTWHHVCGIEISSTSRAAYIDGGSKGTNTQESSPTGADRVTIGRAGDSSPNQHMTGRIAEPLIWNVALSDAEVALLAKGVNPYKIRPGNIVSHWPLVRDDDRDWVGGFDLTAFGTPTVATHAPLAQHPILGPRFFSPAGAAPSVPPSPSLLFLNPAIRVYPGHPGRL